MLLLTDQLQEVELYLTAPLYVYGIEDLSMFDKLLFTVIYGLTKNNGTTTRPDIYFMELLGKSDKTVARSMKRLEDLSLIRRETIFNRKTRKRTRKIRLIHKTREVIHAPMEIYFHDLTDGAKLLLIQLVGLSKKDGYTFVRNDELAEKLNISSSQTKRYLRELKVKNFIFLEDEQSSSRIIFTNEDMTDDSITFEGGHDFSSNLLQTSDIVKLNFSRLNHNYKYTLGETVSNDDLDYPF